MSQIFDALQRSEAERTGIDLQALSVATQLLQVAEWEAAAEGRIVEQPHTPAQPEIVAQCEAPAPLETTVAPTAATHSPAAPKLLNDTGVDQLTQFRSLRVPLPPQSRLVCLTEKDSLAAENFRFLAVRLRQLRQSRPLKKILITSTIPEEGKSTVAGNLACTLARRKQQKTLLLEGDLRRPTLAAQFGLGKIPGLCEWLSGETETINLYRLESLELWVMPAGAAPQNPLELMQSGRLASLMDQLEAWFDWIVVDTPPVLPLADTSMWSRLADGILLVTRNCVTERQQLQRGLEALEKSKLLGALVNCSASAAHSDYYARYRSPSADHPKT